MQKNIAIVVPHRGVGDIVFHYEFFLSIYKYHKKKLILYAPYSTKANLIYNKNKIFKKVILVDLKRPNMFLYIFKIIKLTVKLSKYKYEHIYYTGNNKWHRVSFYLLSYISDFKINFFKIKKYFILDHLKDFLKKLSIKQEKTPKFLIQKKVTKKFIYKINKYKKPWAFLSIDTAADQIQIPKKILSAILKKLDSKYNTIFINTSIKNKHKINFINEKKIIPTYMNNILEINYIMKLSKIFIGNDSGPANLSSLFKQKSIIFLSKNTKGEITRFPYKGKRKYCFIENVNKTIKNILNFI